MSKHTSGPWRADGLFIMRGKTVLAETIPTSLVGEHGEEHANAALIAAAPEVLAAGEALNEAVELYLASPSVNNMDRLTAALRESRVVFNKARGRAIGALLTEISR
jgi:hypothetical protein